VEEPDYMLQERQRSGRRFAPSFMAGMNPRPSTGTACRALRKAKRFLDGFPGAFVRNRDEREEGAVRCARNDGGIAGIVQHVRASPDGKQRE